MEMKITPILAAILAYLDTNCNLELFWGTAAAAWKRKMWLGPFKDPAVTLISYSDLVSVKSGAELTEMTIQMTGAQGTPMQGQLPFSWLLKAYIDILVNEKRKMAGKL